MDGEGWFNTGDLARKDAQGYIRISGRAKDVIIRGGENIPVVEVEELLFRHPAIAAAAVVAMPDERLGERACAFVQLRPGATLDFSGLIAYLTEQKMARAYFPERLEIVPELPRTPSGKLQKFLLRDRAKSLVPHTQS
jgi:cyclohexanecarboxylate-CoA ligase